jgi:hypothetical protein
MKLTEVPVFLQASSKLELVKAMLKNNSEKSKYFNYSTPMLEGTKWVVWYVDDVENAVLKEATKK